MFARLESADVILVEIGRFGEFFLRPTAAFPQLADAFPERFECLSFRHLT